MKTTLAQIRSYGPCQDRWNYGLQHADPLPADDEPFPVSRVLDVNGLNDTLWLLGEMGEKQLLVRFTCGCAERAVERYWEPEYPDDRRPQEAIAAARRWAENPTEENRAKADAATEAATAAAEAAQAAAPTAAAVARAAYYAAAAVAVEDAAHVAFAAAKDAAAAVARAAYYAAAAVEDAAHAAVAFAAAEDAAAKEREWQIDHLRKLLEDA